MRHNPCRGRQAPEIVAPFKKARRADTKPQLCQPFGLLVGKVTLPVAIATGRGCIGPPGLCLQLQNLRFGLVFVQLKNSPRACICATSKLDRGCICATSKLARGPVGRDRVGSEPDPGDARPGNRDSLDRVWWRNDGGPVVGVPRDQQIAVGFSGSQKTLMVGLSAAISMGLNIIPIVAYHAMQLLVDTVIADQLKKRNSS